MRKEERGSGVARQLATISGLSSTEVTALVEFLKNEGVDALTNTDLLAKYGLYRPIRSFHDEMMIAQPSGRHHHI